MRLWDEARHKGMARPGRPSSLGEGAAQGIGVSDASGCKGGDGGVGEGAGGTALSAERSEQAERPTSEAKAGGRRVVLGGVPLKGETQQSGDDLRVW